MIHVTFRDGPMHSQEQFDSLCIEVQDIWSSIVNPSLDIKMSSELVLGTVYVTGGILTALESGYIVPKPGKEKEWAMGNMESFKQRAQEGNKNIASLLEELQSRLSPAK
jgi:hypothetical protein